jgi:hypothetical protein
MSNARDRRRRLGAYYTRDWRTPNYDRFLKATLKAYSWPMVRMFAPDEPLIRMEAWARRENAERSVSRLF